MKQLMLPVKDFITKLNLLQKNNYRLDLLQNDKRHLRLKAFYIIL